MNLENEIAADELLASIIADSPEMKAALVEHRAEEKAAEDARRLADLSDWYADSPSGSVLAAFERGDFETINAGGA